MQESEMTRRTKGEVESWVPPTDGMSFGIYTGAHIKTPPNSARMHLQGEREDPAPLVDTRPRHYAALIPALAVVLSCPNSDIPDISPAFLLHSRSTALQYHLYPCILLLVPTPLSLQQKTKYSGTQELEKCPDRCHATTPHTYPRFP
jgi:hypothetical protein